jgi:hypothetical protein
MFTNLIKHIITETVTRLLAMITPADVLEAVSDSERAHDALVSAAQKFVTRSSVAAIAAEIEMSDLAREIDYHELASNLDIDYSELAGNLDIDYSELAGEIDLRDLAGNLDIDYYEFAKAAEIDHAALAAEIEVDYDRLADLCGKGLGTPEGDRALEDRINEAVGHAIGNAIEIVRRADEAKAAEAKAAETAETAETVPDLTTRLLTAAVDRLLALADDAAKNGLL